MHSWFTLLDAIVALSELAASGTVPDEFMMLPIGKIVPVEKTALGEEFVTIPSNKTLQEGIELMLEKQVHRVAVGFGEEHSTAPLVSVISDSRVARVLLAASSSDPATNWHKTIRERGLVGNREPIFVAKDAPVAQAFEKMQKEGVRR